MVMVLKSGATKREMASINRKLASRKSVNMLKFCGVIRLKEDPLAIQKRLRNEWK